ncbi:hypothetical protein [Kribbella sp. DT2]|uniref:hypothetical protein n=1 Tax=Kribbella sp. DT2 TaxID=3393427 RepID=UPI003CF6FA9A
MNSEAQGGFPSSRPGATQAIDVHNSGVGPDAAGASGPTYAILLAPDFEADLRRLADEDQRTGSRLQIAVIGLVKQLAEGRTDGHHCLGYEPGKGDLRDCVTAYVRSGRESKADYRLVFREIGAENAGGKPRRELLAIRPRRGATDAYAHVCARLKRHPSDRQPGLNRFGNRLPGRRDSESGRQAELDTKRAIAHAWAGQKPLATSRPLRGTPIQARAPGRGPKVGQSIGSPSGTGWPERR